MTQVEYFIGVDVGTGSVRSAVFDHRGHQLHSKARDIITWKPQPDYYEQSSSDIWSAVCETVKGCLEHLDANLVRGIGFDATCSLVVLDKDDQPLSVSPTENNEQNIILWMDHRAVDQANRINKTNHSVLKFVGGVISPEMEGPKLLWLKEHKPATWAKAAKFFDLVDFLTYAATGVDVRSACTVTCKWTFQAHKKPASQAETDFDASYGWDKDFFTQIGLEDLISDGHAKIGRKVGPMGYALGSGLTPEAAKQLGLPEKTAVSIGIIDAHAGGIGTLGAVVGTEAITPETLEHRVALIAGTSACHMAVSQHESFIQGIWGPYYNAMVPSMWLTEGGQSAVGALLDHIVLGHPASVKLFAEAQSKHTTIFALLNDRIECLAQAKSLHHSALLTKGLHMLPDFHGNRSPRADPKLHGMISGLTLASDEDSLALLYLATLQALSHGTRHIIAEMNKGGYRIDTIFLTGGFVKNPLFVREIADVTGCKVVIPREADAVLLGSAILGAVASKKFDSILSGMKAMNHIASITEPTREPAVVAFHARKHQIFQEMYHDQIKYEKMMTSE